MDGKNWPPEIISSTEGPRKEHESLQGLGDVENVGQTTAVSTSVLWLSGDSGGVPRSRRRPKSSATGLFSPWLLSLFCSLLGFCEIFYLEKKSHCLKKKYLKVTVVRMRYGSRVQKYARLPFVLTLVGGPWEATKVIEWRHN